MGSVAKAIWLHFPSVHSQPLESEAATLIPERINYNLFRGYYLAYRFWGTSFERESGFYWSPSFSNSHSIVIGRNDILGNKDANLGAEGSVAVNSDVPGEVYPASFAAWLDINLTEKDTVKLKYSSAVSTTSNYYIRTFDFGFTTRF